MINKQLLQTALSHLGDAHLNDNDDNKFDLEIVKQYLDQQAKKLDPKARGTEALYLHCFATEVLKQLPESPSDLFSMSEEDFIVGLYPFSKLIIGARDDAIFDGLRFQELAFVYGLMEELAGAFIEIVFSQKITLCSAMAYELPELDEFELEVIRVVPSCVR